MNLAINIRKEEGQGNLPPWYRLTTQQRHREMTRYAQGHQGYALTLNLRPEFAELLRDQEKPMRTIGKRMNAELNRLDLRQLPVLLVLEATRPEGRLHLHGVYLAGGIPKRRIQEAMRRAVGYIPGRSGSRQFQAKLLYAADGWNNYIVKDRGWTKKLLSLSDDEQNWWVSHRMTQIVCKDYEDTRLGRKAAANNNGPRVTAL